MRISLVVRRSPSSAVQLPEESFPYIGLRYFLFRHSPKISSSLNDSEYRDRISYAISFLRVSDHCRRFVLPSSLAIRVSGITASFRLGYATF